MLLFLQIETNVVIMVNLTLDNYNIEINHIQNEVYQLIVEKNNDQTATAKSFTLNNPLDRLPDCLNINNITLLNNYTTLLAKKIYNLVFSTNYDRKILKTLVIQFYALRIIEGQLTLEFVDNNRQFYFTNTGDYIYNV
jgi:hypothetical protein